MKKSILSLVIVLVLFSCSTTQKGSTNKPLYEVLLQQNDGGANINFYEILSEPKEIKMLLNDEKLKGKISTNDVQQSNFIVLNMGEKPTGGYGITVDSVVETEKNIVIKVKEITPEAGAMLTQSITYPYSVVKINSKKEIIVK
ncbi:protease complex subunit PrcB family protein [Flavobacterium undicola]|uniref:protease complex subunit PrcB family protein n=1 Tax=Flavobacterium undicola TaxID=1932779 RepID=UPI001377CC74|nr:protease complex subunit PrcB family protein [Flavobacterium undicola]MBA0882375.1 protease complex subunit PrcB family protein [Flavobacterium undicola]